MVCLARIITFQLLFEFTKRRELSDIDGNVIPCFQSRIVKAFLDIFKVISFVIPYMAGSRSRRL